MYLILCADCLEEIIKQYLVSVCPDCVECILELYLILCADCLEGIIELYGAVLYSLSYCLKDILQPDHLSCQC